MLISNYIIIHQDNVLHLLVSSRTSILIHNITPSDTVRHLGVLSDRDFNFRKLISLTCRCCFYHFHDLRLIGRYSFLSVAKTIATASITSRFDYCNSIIYSMASIDIAKLRCVLNCLARIITRSSRFSHYVPLLKSLGLT